jgi:prevent-host-death family protein
MKTVGLFQAKSQFSAIICEVESGESIVVTKKGKPVARIVPFGSAAKPREFGFDQGRIWMAEDFNELPPDIAAAFEGK